MRHTHTGHCQLCDRQQAVNVTTGLLAKHGYTKRWGFFSGTCPGSGALPYERSCLEIAPVIVHLEGTVARFCAHILTIRNMSETHPLRGKLSIRRPLPPGHYSSTGSNAEVREVMGDFVADSPQPEGAEHIAGYVRTQFIPLLPVTFATGIVVAAIDSRELTSRCGFYKERNPLQYAQACRMREIQALQTDLSRHEDYIKWLRERVLNWKLCELVPGQMPKL